MRIGLFSRFKHQTLIPAAGWLSHQTALVRVVAAIVLGFLITWVLWHVLGIVIVLPLLALFVTHANFQMSFTPANFQVDYQMFQTIEFIIFILKLVEIVVFVAVTIWVYRLLDPERSASRDSGNPVSET